MKKLIIISTFIFALPVVAQQDTILNAVVEVENLYNPKITSAQKINTVPLQEQPSTAPLKEIAFSQETVLLTGFNNTMKLENELPVQPLLAKGYARAGVGNYGNLEGKFNYRMPVTTTDVLTFDFSFDGWKGDMRREKRLTDEWNSRLYNTTIDVDFVHSFKTMNLYAKTNFGSQVFNYKNTADFTSYTNKQHDTFFDLRAGVQSTTNASLSYNVETGFRGYSQSHFGALGRASEYDWRTKGNVAYQWNNSNEVALGLVVHGLTYGGTAKERNYVNYFSMEFNPNYTFGAEKWSLRLGAHLDLLTNNGKSFQISPDVYGEYTLSPNAIIYASVTGGRQMIDHWYLSQISPYWYTSEQYKPSYTQYDASVGFKMSPLDGLWFNIFGGYKTVDDYYFRVASNYMQTWLGESFEYIYAIGYQDKVHAAYLGGSLKYNYKDNFSLLVKADYRKWSSDTKNPIAMNYLPIVDLDFNARGKIIDNLFVTAGYRFCRYVETPVGRGENKNDLSAGISYRFMEQYRCFIQADNLLNKKYNFSPGYITQGTNFLVGVEATF